MNRWAIILFGLFGLGLGGCVTPTVWSKPGLSPVEANNDEGECRQAAWREANLQRHSSYGFYPAGPFSPYRGPPYAHGFGPWGQDPFLESRLNDFCMRAKGYQRVPVEGR